MQEQVRISLNAVRVFTTAARHGSIAAAAKELNVSASAVSHQIKKLEADLGTSLFVRSNNSITLTDTGRRFFEDSISGIAVINRSAQTLIRMAEQIVVRVSVDVAVRWFVSALEDFKSRHPEARVRVDTTHAFDAPLSPTEDAAIVYRRSHDDSGKGELLLRDFSRPVVAPALLAACGYHGPEDIGKLPALQCTEDLWDWRLWAKQMGLKEATIRIAHEFDLDDAAIRAACAGLGMVLAPRLTTRSEIEAGTLVALPGFEAIEMGRYYLLLGPRDGGIVGEFRSWLLEIMSRERRLSWPVAL